jgi:SSS family transporter
MQLALFDLVVLVLYLAAVVMLGLWLGRGPQDAKRYLLGGKDAAWWLVLGSIVATETSTVTFLSVPGLSYKEGGNLAFLQLTCGYIIGRVLIAYWFLPLYFRGQLFSAYEVLRKRFGSATQRVASLIFIVTRNVADGLRLFLTALVLQKTLQWDIATCVVVIGVCTTVFTMVGGMKAVIWNDCIQLLVYMLGGVVALVLIVGRLPEGWSEYFSFGSSTGRFQWFQSGWTEAGWFDFSQTYTFWGGLIGGMFLTLGTHGTDQMMVQRSLAARSERDARIALIASGFFVALQFALFLAIGVALASFYSQPGQMREFRSSDEVFATYIVQEIPRGVGLVGLLLAAVFSAAISTLSSSLNSSATAVISDFVDPAKRQWSQSRVVWTSRLLTVVFGAAQIGIGICAQYANSAVIDNALAVAGFAAGLLLGIFALGALSRRVGQGAAIVGLVVGAAVLLLVKFVMAPTVVIAWPWFPVIGSIVTFASAWITSWLPVFKERALGSDA